LTTYKEKVKKKIISNPNSENHKPLMTFLCLHTVYHVTWFPKIYKWLMRKTFFMVSKKQKKF